uniref:Uncharacterized protein n=1 Tax=Chelonoidis abingdonii TaxID=106734 RepID=A0A8C0JGT9_CHEAB
MGRSRAVAEAAHVSITREVKEEERAIVTFLLAFPPRHWGRGRPTPLLRRTVTLQPSSPSSRDGAGGRVVAVNVQVRKNQNMLYSCCL